MVAGDPQKKKWINRGQEGIPLADEEFEQFRALTKAYKLNVELD